MRDPDDDLATLGGLSPVRGGLSLQATPADALFSFADRRCRRSPNPAAPDLLLRSSALRALALPAEALTDLRSAFRRSPDDATAARSVLSWDPDDGLKAQAAASLLADPRAGDGDIDAALGYRIAAGAEIVVRAHRANDRISGWVASISGAMPDARATHEDGSFAVALTQVPRHPFPSFGGSLAGFAFDWDARRPIELVVTGGNGVRDVVRLYATEAPMIASSPGEIQDRSASGLTVIVPLYGDHESAKACLEALALQECSVPPRVYLVDDHSPEPEISALAECYCRLHDATLIVHRVNHGFAGSVNAVLARCGGGDVLLLNSDVTLPPGAIDRLVRAAQASPDIGTVMPLSNDSEMTSFPAPYESNPLASADLAIRIDDAARRANGDEVVDIVNTIGFCVYVTQRCIEAVGPLSQAYGRGYYEDVEFALKARERGFRNVCATGVYVAHGSGRSFREEKRTLVSRNLPIVCDRFPAFRFESRAFVEVDPLRAARGAIERHLPPDEPAHLLVGAAAASGTPMTFRVRRIVEEGGFALTLSWRQRGPSTQIEIRAYTGFGPRSLDITLDDPGLESLTGYLLALRLVQIELCDLHTIPSPLYRLLLRTSAPILFFVASLDDALLVDSGAPQPGQERLTSRDITLDFLGFEREADLFAYRIPQFLMRSSPSAGASKFVTADSMAEAVCADLHHRSRAAPDSRKNPPIRPPARPHPKRCVAVLVPSPSPAVELLLLDIARHIRSRAETRLVVMGRCLDDRALMAIGNVHVTGPVTGDDYPGLLRAYGADALFLPYRTSLFGVLETLSGRSDLPRGYFDWSGGLMPYRPDDFVIDCRLGTDVVCVEFARWCAPVLHPPEVRL